VLEQLRSAGVMQAILTNGLRASAFAKARAIGFDGKIVASEDTGFRKPDPQAFRALIDSLALPPECIWYLGTDYRMDIEPARAAGMNAVWLTDDAAASPPAVRRMEEFLDVVQEPYTRSLLGLRYIMHNALAWRPGHFVPGEEYGLGG
jgi:putative hydrolase of the HAD superfamily